MPYQKQFDRFFCRYKKNLGGMNLLILILTKELINLCGLVKQTLNQIEKLKIEYFILPEYSKQGYASRAAKKCRNFTKEESLVQSIIPIIHIDSITSQKVALLYCMQLNRTVTYYTFLEPHYVT
ncbi:GNAT family N-acetyltransferase [Zobellia nedashkovskayae]